MTYPGDSPMTYPGDRPMTYPGGDRRMTYPGDRPMTYPGDSRTPPMIAHGSSCTVSQAPRPRPTRGCLSGLSPGGRCAGCVGKAWE
ncbi:hypothetical protein PAPYR_6526 [Paratrimastix pyriformis]|uniref:Uncharacterized protein n=1 Tax=Paratrimastix pyriformis TaxID=342808 RepID=A0ABQ8UK68_9EUKA|nr:hypothetical protein PAPYR_6526 [Paratrimastix pyriformis]